MKDVAEHSPPPPITRRELQMVFAGLMMAMALAALDQNIVTTALPRIVSDLGGLAYLSWVVTAFMLTSTMTTPLYGKLSDTYGRKPMFYIAITLFLAGGILSGLSQTMWQLIAFRAVQGCGAGGLMTLAQTTIGDVLEPRERPKYQGWFTGVWAVCSVAGPLVGGFITSALSWRWIFYVNIPVGLAAVLLISIALKRPPPRVRHRIDLPGAVLLMGATSCLMLVLSWGGSQYPWSSPLILGLAAAAAVFSILLFLQEQRHPEPILSVAMFRRPVFAVAASVLALMAMSLFGTMVFMSLYFQLVAGVEPYVAGLLLSPQLAGLICASIVGGHLVSRTGRYKIFMVVGVGLTALTLAAVAWLTAHGGAAAPIGACLFVMGIGQGLTMPNLTVAVQNAVERDRLGQATAAMSFMRSLGASLGVSLLGGLMSAELARALAHYARGMDARSMLRGGVEHILRLPAGEKAGVVVSYQDAIGTVFLAGAGVAALAFLIVLALPELSLRTREVDPLATEL